MVPASSKKLAQYKLGKVQSTSLFKLWSGFRNRVNRIVLLTEAMRRKFSLLTSILIANLKMSDPQIRKAQ